MTRILTVLLLLPLLARPALAQQLNITPPSAPVPVPATVSPQDTQRLLEILKDDQRRAELIKTLEALAAALPPPAQLAPDSLGGQLLAGTRHLLDEFGDQAREAMFALGGLRWLGHWLVATLGDPVLRAWLLDATWRLALVLVLSWLGAWAVRRSVRPARARLITRASAWEPASPSDAMERAEMGATEPLPEPEARGVLPRRLPCAAGCLALDLLSVVCFVLVAHLLLATPLGGTDAMQVANLAMVHAIALWATVLALTAALVAPGAPGLRLLPVSNDNAAYLMRWAGRIAAIVLFAGAVLPAAMSMGLPQQAYAGWLKLVSLVVVLCLVTIVLQRRRSVFDWLDRGTGEAGPIVWLRRRVAPFWHWLAIACVLFLWLGWVAEYGGGTSRVLWTLLASLLVLTMARLTNRGLERVLAWLLDGDAGLARRFPGLDGRTRGYRPLLRTVSGLFVAVLGTILMLEVWGFSPLRWLTSTHTGRDVLTGIGTIGVTLLLALAVWELINLAFIRHMARLAEQAQAVRSARLRTVLPMLRTALLIVIVIVVGLTVLSQIGINIAPLLAGAGVIGIAIGFGSQRLVQDVITGLFLLLENTMQVGDVVTLGGATGVVEELSIRTIRLRTEDGSMQIIPFSAVTTVTNMTRDFSQAVIEVQVDYKNDYDQVVELLRDIATEMRAEPLWENEILADLEVMGLIRLEPNAVVVKGRIKCGPFGRWKVQREFFRRMKQVFAENGIEPPRPVQA